MEKCGVGDVGGREAGAFPQQARCALADGVQAFDVDGVEAGAKAEGAAVVAHGVAGCAADLREGRAGFGDLDAVDDNSGAVTGEEVEGVAAIDGDVEETIPSDRVAGEAMGVGEEVRRIRRSKTAVSLVRSGSSVQVPG